MKGHDRGFIEQSGWPWTSESVAAKFKEESARLGLLPKVGDLMTITVVTSARWNDLLITEVFVDHMQYKDGFGSGEKTDCRTYCDNVEAVGRLHY